MPLSLPSDYSYEDGISGPQNPSPSPPGTPVDWYVDMEERHYEDLRQHNLETQMEADMQQQQLQIYEEGQRNEEDLEQNFCQFQVDEEVVSIFCRCGNLTPISIVRFGEEVGRRYSRCAMFPLGCDYFQWIDEQLTGRTAEYVRELENEITSLRFQLSSLTVEAPRRRRRSH